MERGTKRVWETNFVTTFNYMYEEFLYVYIYIQQKRLSAMTSFDEWAPETEISLWADSLSLYFW